MAIDLMLDEDNKLRIENGDLVAGDSRYQHAKHILQYEKGFDKFNPVWGVSPSRLINDELNPEDPLRLFRLELERDGFRIEKLLMTNDGKIEIDGDYV